MKKSIAKNYLLNLSYQILVMIVPLITTPYISRVLGAEGVGTYSYTYSIVTYFILVAALGTTTYAQREIAFYQNCKHEQSIIFFEILILRFCTSLICGIFYFYYVWNFGIPIIGLVQGLYIVGVATDISWFFQGLEEFAKTVQRNMVVKLLNVIIIFLFVKTADDLILYIFSLAFLPILGNLTLWFYLPSCIEKISLVELNPRRHLKGTFQLFIPSIATQIYLVLDKTMIGVFTDTGAENGYYEQAEKLVKVCLMLITSLGTVMVPRIASTFINGENEKIKLYMQRAYRFVWFLALPMFGGLLLMADMIVPWFLGVGYEKTSFLIGIFSFLVVAIGLNNVTGVQYLIPTKKQNIYTLTVISGAVVNVILNGILIPRFYSVGAAVASITAESTITIVQLIYVIYFAKAYKWCDVFKGIGNYLFSCIIMYIAILAIKQKYPYTFWGTAALAGTGAFIYALILLLLRDDFFIDLLKKIKGMIMYQKRKRTEKNESG